jgi:competence ComEA-like helix-hairpin-helix protein
MLFLTKEERQVLIFLGAVALLGLGLSYLKKIKLTGWPQPLSVERESLSWPLPKEEEARVISLNHADIEELASLPGIGPVLAGRIVSYRQQNGPFDNIEKIKEVPGIGDKKFQMIKEFLSLH